ncbi:MAG: DUF697 domain-containing protein [Planctomycetes bacterium]|nr:DUF697 domain-containing protein [Planctomycetota bacterium]
MLERLKSLFGLSELSDEQFERQRQELVKKTPVPVIWLFGKTGSGKSSIVRYLTGESRATIGNGYRPETKRSDQYEFPSSDQPIIRFIDTRGLGESGYDPSEDISAFDKKAHVVLVVARAMDHALAEIVTPLKAIRASRPTRPVVLALTCLHEAYPLQQHPDPDPFQLHDWMNKTSNGFEVATGSEASSVPAASSEIPPELLRSIREQQDRFSGLVDRIVPIDLTLPEEGFTNSEFGGSRLKQTLIEVLPEACRQVILHLDDVQKSLADLTAQKAIPIIIRYSSLAASAAAAPLPWIDIPVVMGLQSRLIYVLADLYGQKMNAELLSQMAGAAAGRLAIRFAVKAPLKMIPILGQTANVAMAFAYTYSLGKACCWYFGEVRKGATPSSEELNRVWSEQLSAATNIWQNERRGADENASM